MPNISADLHFVVIRKLDTRVVGLNGTLSAR